MGGPARRRLTARRGRVAHLNRTAHARSPVARRCGAAGIAVLRGIADAGTAPQRIATLQAAIAEAGNAPPLPLPELPRSTLGASRVTRRA